MLLPRFTEFGFVCAVVAAATFVAPTEVSALALRETNSCRNFFDRLCADVNGMSCEEHFNLENPAEIFGQVLQDKTNCYLSCLANDRVTFLLKSEGCLELEGDLANPTEHQQDLHHGDGAGIVSPPQTEEEEQEQQEQQPDEGSAPSFDGYFIKASAPACAASIRDTCGCTTGPAESRRTLLVSSQADICVRNCIFDHTEELDQAGCFDISEDEIRHWRHIRDCDKLFRVHCFACVASVFDSDSNRAECAQRCFEAKKPMFEMEGCKLIGYGSTGTSQSRWKIRGASR